MTDTMKIGPLRVRPHIRDGRPSGRWQLDIPARFTMAGRRDRILFVTKSDATAEAKRRLRDIQLKGAVERHAPTRSGFTLSEVVGQWTDEEESRVRTLKKRASSLATDLQRLHAVLAYLGADDIAGIGERRLVAYQEHRIELGRKPNTINGELRSLRVVFGWAKRRGLIKEMPAAEGIPVYRNDVALPTPVEMARIIKHLPPNLAFLVRFLAETGVRKGEAFHLTWADVDEINGTVAIHSKDGWTPKTQHSERRIFLSPGLLNQLRRQPKVSQWVFPGRNPSNPITRFDDALAVAVRGAGVLRNGRHIHLTPHMLRKANATWQAMRGVVPSVLQSMLGHAPGSKVTEKHYIHAVEETIRQSVLELPVEDDDPGPSVLATRRE